MNFRYDINGLRAIAVSAVVIFHFNPNWLPGGFAGVDVFFVISGFLMTSIIFNELDKNSFNLFKFYNSRANRIIPVLAAMSVCLLIFGWFYLAPNDYSNLGRQIEKTSYFTSNILFSRGGGYFDTAEHTKWLLHTWSLSVEWQFYILFPVIIILLNKYLNLMQIKRVILALFLASFIYCIYATYKDSKTAYFVLTSRAWEMLLGGLAFLYPLSFKNNINRIVLQYCGLILIISSYFFISKNMPWPGYMALIPVLGSYLIILSHYQNNIILNNAMTNKIGQWSYSIYVWHWPLVVFGFYFAIVDWWMLGIPLSILLGFLSYNFIEKINFPRFNSWKDILKVKPFYLFLFIFISGYLVKDTDGFKNHYSKEVLEIIEPARIDLKQECETSSVNSKLTNCTIGNKTNIKAIIVGDSHASSLLPNLTSKINLHKEGILSISTPGCPFILNAHFNSTYNYCDEVNKIRFDYLSNIKDTPIILVSRYLQRMEGENDPSKENKQIIYFTEKHENKNLKYEYFETNFEKTICGISKQNPVFVVQSIPEQGKNVPQVMAKNLILKVNQDEIGISKIEYEKRSNKINRILESVASKCGAKILSPAKILCKTGTCISNYDGHPLYSDGDHINQYGNKILAPMFDNIIN
ncbi:acyltransferase [Acinetobacter sp. NCu2D-2]|uniref:acyltransferase family protein n=1 Tax=Acinetobacter sp. NCu2D-2 TaxID=1608473 RepID=UPI0007CE0465|nr:acyltransferase family protein [Acinetobacter sp. NCu2D-2]ANF81756.1 acyltransferase [Acinetobacter sp. NCu2D-2]